MNDLKNIRIRASAPVTLEAKAEGKAVRKFSMVAYTGAAMDIFGWSAPVVVDLSPHHSPGQPDPCHHLDVRSGQKVRKGRRVRPGTSLSRVHLLSDSGVRRRRV